VVRAEGGSSILRTRLNRYSAFVKRIRASKKKPKLFMSRVVDSLIRQEVSGQMTRNPTLNTFW